MKTKIRRRLDPERATTIKDMPAPENVSSLQSFLGLVNFYQVFIPNMHSLRALFNEILKKIQGLGVDTLMLGSIRQNKRSLDVGLVSHQL